MAWLTFAQSAKFESSFKRVIKVDLIKDDWIEEYDLFRKWMQLDMYH